MRYRHKQSGFSAVELLITLFVAAVFLITGFQLYAVILENGGDARQQSSAANVAANYMQQYESSATSPCTPGTPLNSQSVPNSGLTNATVTVTITCPNITSPSFSATGGTKTNNGGLTVHTFTSSGTFTVNYGSENIQYLVVGGGGGGYGNLSGGGGGGGVLTGNQTMTPGSTSITIGTGGTGAVPYNNTATNGGNSTFGNLTALGGGRGGSRDTSGATPGSGGTGGGGGSGNTSSNTTGGSGTAGQGYGGGNGTNPDLGVPSAGGGGGGGGAAGVAGASNVGGNGGVGFLSNINGTATYYGGGGGGSTGGSTQGTGGLGGGGNAGAAGTANTGGGGGAGANGGSGIVIISYPTPVATTLTNVSKIVATVTYGSSKTVSNSTYVSTTGIVTNGLALNLDAGLTNSYPGAGSTWTDLTNNGNNGTLSTTGVTYSNSNNGILTFNGSSGSVNAGNGSSIDISGAITLDAWVKASSVAVGSAVIVKANGGGNLGSTSYSLGINAGGTISNVLYSPTSADSYTTASQYIYAGNWYNVVMTWDGSAVTSNNVRMYVNGSLVQSFTKNDTLDSNTQTLTIGSQQTAGNFFNGSIGAIKIYNRALTDSEITQNFNALRGRYGL